MAVTARGTPKVITRKARKLFPVQTSWLLHRVYKESKSRRDWHSDASEERVILCDFALSIPGLPRCVSSRHSLKGRNGDHRAVSQAYLFGAVVYLVSDLNIISLPLFSHHLPTSTESNHRWQGGTALTARGVRIRQNLK